MEPLTFLNGLPLLACTGIAGAWGILAALFLLLSFLGAPLWVWTLFAGAGFSVFHAPLPAWIALGVAALLLNAPPLRRLLVSWPAMKAFKALKLVPAISESEMQALRSGQAWVDADLFSGKPDWGKLAAVKPTALSAEEKAFLEGPVEQVCAMVDDWTINQERDLPPAVWAFLKQQRFFGMIIPKEHGGLGFSAEAHSQVIKKLSSRSLTLSVTVMVPNSLGPGELILHYGTDEQKKYFLPRLAHGEEIPCFALTEPEAGSDAGGIRSSGVVIRRPDGSLGLKLNWDKRYITLASVATLLGLAVKVRDPEKLLGSREELGITCVLVQTNQPGIQTKRRHNPLGVPFHNCPTTGTDVVVSLDSVIGGTAGIGKGWEMLMACLAAGRGISLPATATGGAALAARVIGDYAAVRQQFGIPIGKLEGLHEPIGTIGALAWLLEAARRYTCAGIDAGVKPPVITAIAKYHFTELFRKVINHAMDVQGGAAISLGPRNLLGNMYAGTPIIITVEGANIMTRTLIHFGQGLFRCHPYAFRLVDALASHDLASFDRQLWGMAGHVWRNAFRSALLFLTRGRFLLHLGFGPLAGARKRLSWASATFALLADLALGLVGGNLKRRGMLSGRFGDALSWLYLATAAMARWEQGGSRREERPFVVFAVETALHEIQRAFLGILDNFGGPVGALLLRPIGGTLLRLNPFGRPVSDRLLTRISERMQRPGEARDALGLGIFYPSAAGDPLARLEEAFTQVQAAQPIERKIRHAQKARALPSGKPENLAAEALAKGVIDASEKAALERTAALRREVVQVDAFTLEEYARIGTPAMLRGG